MLEKIAAMLGASPTQYKYLLQTEKLMEKRALEGKNNFVNLPIVATWVFCFLISIPPTAIPFFFPIDIFSYALMGITVSMLMMGASMGPYFNILLSPINYPVIAHTPVSSRTYFLVKLTQILKYTVPLLACLNLMPAIGGIWIRMDEASQFQYFFPIVYLPVAFMSGFFTIGVMAIFAGYKTKLYTKKWFRNIAQYLQLFPFLLLCVLVYYYIYGLYGRLHQPDLSPDILMDELTSILNKLTSILKWFEVLPNGWFAGIVALVLGQIERPNIVRNLISTGLVIASTLFLVFVPLRSVAKSYSEYLSYLLESGSRQKSKLRVKTPLFARILRNPAVRAGLCLSFVYIRRDRHLRGHFFGSLVGAIMYTVVMMFNLSMFNLSLDQMRVDHSFVIGLNPGFSAIFYTIGFSMVWGFLLLVKYSEHSNASWMLMLAPLSAVSDLWRGVQAAVYCYLIAPCTLLMLGIAMVVWGVLGIFYVLPVLIILLNFVVFYPKPRAGLPLAEEIVPKRLAAAAGWIFPVSCVFGTVFGFIQFLIYMIDIQVYYGLYCVVVVGGLISFTYLFQKKEWRKS